jgi:hypothetical protein
MARGRHDPEKISPTHLPEIEKFQRMFLVYFPHLHDIGCASFEWSWLYTRVTGNPIETVRRSKAKAEVRKVANALRLLSKHEKVYWRHLPIPDDAQSDSDVHDRISEWEKKIVDILMTLNSMEGRGLTETVIAKFVADAEAGIDWLPETANVNWDAVHAVDSLRWLWWRNTGKHGPSRALNPASEFHSYLRDGFDFLEIEADPASAFKRWAARRADFGDEVV